MTEATKKYFSTEDPERILVMSAQGYPESREIELRLLCGHSHRLPVEHERAHYGFGTNPHHVPCPVCINQKGTRKL
jgi:hypothetical protein